MRASPAGSSDSTPPLSQGQGAGGAGAARCGPLAVAGRGLRLRASALWGAPRLLCAACPVASPTGVLIPLHMALFRRWMCLLAFVCCMNDKHEGIFMK